MMLGLFHRMYIKKAAVAAGKIGIRNVLSRFRFLEDGIDLNAKSQ